MIGTHGVQAPKTTTSARWEIQLQPYDDGQWWTDPSELHSLEEAHEYLRGHSHADRPNRIIRVTETCVYEVVEQGT